MTTVHSRTREKIRLLVVDTAPNWQLELHRELTQAGYSVDIAITADQAIGMLKETSYDLLTLDISLLPPDIGDKHYLGAVDFLRELQRERSIAVIPPIIIISGSVLVDEWANVINFALNNLESLSVVHMIPKGKWREFVYRDEFLRAVERATDGLAANSSNQLVTIISRVDSIVSSLELFPSAVNFLASSGFAGGAIKEEKDVGHLLYMMLQVPAPDIWSEEPTGVHGTKSKRIDFVSRQCDLCLEVKFAKNRRRARNIPDEIKIDLESYYIHPACKNIVVFVYDPYLLIKNAANLEADLSGPRKIGDREHEVFVRVHPK